MSWLAFSPQKRGIRMAFWRILTNDHSDTLPLRYTLTTHSIQMQNTSSNSHWKFCGPDVSLVRLLIYYKIARTFNQEFDIRSLVSQ